MCEGRKFLYSTPHARVRAGILIKFGIQMKCFCSWLKGARGKVYSKRNSEEQMKPIFLYLVLIIWSLKPWKVQVRNLLKRPTSFSLCISDKSPEPGEGGQLGAPSWGSKRVVATLGLTPFPEGPGFCDSRGITNTHGFNLSCFCDPTQPTPILEHYCKVPGHPTRGNK